MAAKTIEKPDIDTDTTSKHARRWKVLILNDDKTTFHFVIWLLVKLFGKTTEEAMAITMEVHDTGAGLATVTHFERAELYVEQVRSLARAQGYPLAATMEEE
jgi:ATP-dependent Clp protease adaptor protein ClpS